MVIIDESAALTVSRSLSLSEKDLKILSLAYLPLIGTDGLSLYLLFALDKSLEIGGECRFAKDLATALGRPIEAITEASRMLEGAGLLRTFSKESKHGLEVLFSPSMPLSPMEFFSGELGNLLLSKVGQKRFESIQYQFDLGGELKTDGFVDSTEAASSVFGSQIEDGISLERKGDDAGKRTLEKAIENELSHLGFTLKVLGDDLDSVISISILYGLTSTLIARLIAESTDSDGIFHLESFKSLVRDRAAFARPLDLDDGKKSKSGLKGNGKLSELSRTLDSLDTPEYLARSLKLTKAPGELLDIAEKMAEQYRYPKGVVNAIFDYCIKKTKSVPSSVYIDKVAISLLPKHPTDAYSAQLCLKEAQVQTRRSIQRKKEVDERLQKRIDKALGEPDKSIQEKLEPKKKSESKKAKKSADTEENSEGLDFLKDLVKGM